MDRFKQIVALFLLAGCIHILVTSFIMSREHQSIKYDLSVINDARYGLFNIDTWKAELKAVLVKQVAEFELQGENREAIKSQLEKMLHVLVDEVEENIRNLDGFFNRIKGLLADVVINFDKLRENIPQYADSILADLEDEENMEALKEAIQSNIDEWIVVTESDSLANPSQHLLSVHGCESAEACTIKLKKEIDFVHERLWIYTALAMVFAALIWIILFFSDLGKFQLYTLGGSSVILLAGGLMLPMIDLQAGMNDIEFTIMNETIDFGHQVLFFQSKSIIDVIHTLFTSATFNGILVGFLILLFSVIFPVSKLIASVIYIFSPKARSGTLMEFLVFKSGKWSMADVFVVAVFMAYLGFSGLINSQLGNLPQSENFHSVSFNASVFQSGFTWFIGFCLSGLFLSVAISKGLYSREEKEA